MFISSIEIIIQTDIRISIEEINTQWLRIRVRSVNIRLRFV